jgi:hypothetical protein
MLRTRIIPHLKKQIDTKEEISATLDLHGVKRIDEMYLKNVPVRKVNKALAEKVLSGPSIMQGEREMLLQQAQEETRGNLEAMDDQRFYAPDDIDEKTWKAQLEGIEWDIEVDVTGEARDVQEALTTLDTALQAIVQPGFEQNKRAQAVVGKILELTGTLSPVEYYALPSPIQPEQAAGKVPSVASNGGLPEQRNIK